MIKFPMPNDTYESVHGKHTIIASAFKTDDIATCIVLNPNPIYYSVVDIDLNTGDNSTVSVHENIVNACFSYYEETGCTDWPEE